MDIPEELYFAMPGVRWQAKRHKIPCPLARTMIDTAQKSLDLWQQGGRAAIWFARLVLSGPTNLRFVTAKLPGLVAEACWRLVNLMDYIADLDEAR